MNRELLREVEKISNLLKKKLKKEIIEVRVFGSRFKGHFHFWSDLEYFSCC